MIGQNSYFKPLNLLLSFYCLQHLFQCAYHSPLGPSLLPKHLPVQQSRKDLISTTTHLRALLFRYTPPCPFTPFTSSRCAVRSCRTNMSCCLYTFPQSTQHGLGHPFVACKVINETLMLISMEYNTSI